MAGIEPVVLVAQSMGGLSALLACRDRVEQPAGRVEAVMGRLAFV